jgi:hypothetical protein
MVGQTFLPAIDSCTRWSIFWRKPVDDSIDPQQASIPAQPKASHSRDAFKRIETYEAKAR